MEGFRNQSGISKLMGALRAIPQHDKVEYLHVLRVAPHLIQTESNPVAFLRFCNGNAVAAARRLTTYWRRRTEVFGQVRAFLPLQVPHDFSGRSALGSEEVEILRSGSFCVLPNDLYGRAVGHGDRTRIPPLLRDRADVQLRALFWCLQQLSGNINAWTAGCVLVIRGYQNTNQSDSGITKGRELINEAFPLHVAQIHLIYFELETTRLAKSVSPFLVEHYGHYLDKTLLHNFESVEQAVETFAKHGISRESLPRTLGGLVETVGSTLSMQPPSGGKTAGSAVVELNPLLGTETYAADEGDPQRSKRIPSPEQQLDAHHRSTIEAAQVAGNDGLLDRGTLDMTAFELPPPPPPPPPPKQRRVETPSIPVAGSDVSLLDVGVVDFNEMPEVTVLGTEAFLLDSPLHRTNIDEVFLDDDAALFTPVPGIAGFGKPKSSLLEPRPIQQRRVAAREPVIPNADKEEGFLSSDVAYVETPDMLKRGLTALNEAMSGLPAEEKASYNEAIQRAPGVVDAESNPLTFLRFEQFNTWAAARRLSLYWKYRVEYFGDRAFLPLTQTMGGALWEEDIQALAAGYLFFLPADSRGRPVLCCDPSKRPESLDKRSRIRSGWYWYNMLWCDYPVTMREGVLVLLFVSPRSSNVVSFDDNTRKAHDIAMDAFPVRKYEVHVIYSPSPTGVPEKSFTEFALPVLLRAMARMMSYRAHFHIGDKPDELERKLAACGLSGSGLQAALNGGISDHEFAQWMKNRQLLERQRFAHRQNQRPLVAQDTLDEGTAGRTARSKSPPRSRREDAVANPQNVHSAMELVSASEKKAYLEALENVPHLVHKESDPVRFLKSENYNGLAAARRLAAYWRIRCDLFSERAFKPMDQTTDGVLGKRDVPVLQSGFLTQLPNDAAGRSVICCDGSRLQKLSRASQLRIFFYMWSVLSENELSQREGYTMLFTMAEPSFERACKECLDLVLEAYPVKLKSFHLLGCCPSGTSESDFRQGPVRDSIKLLDRSVQDKVILHVCESRGEFASKLAGHGLSETGLPVSFGGKWGWEDFVQWQELRVRHEWNLPNPRTGSARELAEMYAIPDSGPPISSLNEREKAERHRRLNVVHSRRKRERTRLEVQMLQDQCSALGEEQKGLLREGRALEGLLQSAEAIVHETGLTN